MFCTGSQVASDRGNPAHLTKYWVAPSNVIDSSNCSALKTVWLSINSADLVLGSWRSGPRCSPAAGHTFSAGILATHSLLDFMC